MIFFESKQELNIQFLYYDETKICLILIKRMRKYKKCYLQLCNRLRYNKL